MTNQRDPAPRDGSRSRAASRAPSAHATSGSPVAVDRSLATSASDTRSREQRVRDEALGNSICSFVPLLSYDEKRVVDTIVQRILKVGRDSYAPLDLARDERDWGAEAASELADTLFYLAAREVAANDSRLERLRCEAADELAGRVDAGLDELRDAALEQPRRVAETAFDLGGEA